MGPVTVGSTSFHWEADGHPPLGDGAFGARLTRERTGVAVPRGTGLYDNADEPDEDDRGRPMQSADDVDTDKPTPDVIEADDEDEPSG